MAVIFNFFGAKTRMGQQKNETFIYQLVSIDTMNTQINVRLPEKVLVSAKSYTEEHGFNSIQEFIKEAIREKLFEKTEI